MRIQMNPEKIPANTESENNESKLLRFDDNKVSSGRDINTKITALDTDLAQMRMELGAINNSVEEGLDRLGDTDTDLTAKVSETYKRLGEIDNAYKSLLAISTRINNDIQKLDDDVSSVAVQSASGIKNLEQSSIVQSHEFTQKNHQVASRVNQLVETSKLSSELLGQKIQSTTDMMLQIEKRVITEIESLSSATKDKTETIESSVASSKAKIIKLQHIDEAIIRRATTLEISSAELTVASQHMGVSVEQLERSSEVLSKGLDQLQSRTKALEVLTNSHGSLIDGLQKAGADISDKLSLLAGRERKHFNIVTAGFLLLLVATAVIYFAQQDQFSTNDTRLAQRSDIVDSKIISLQQLQASSNAITNDSLLALQSRIEEEIALVDYKLQNVEDQVQSVEGRLSETSPFSQIADDNIIHSAQWIAELPKENFTVQLMLTENKSAMYEIAQRYNFYLKDSLSFFEVENKGIVKYVLLSGNYATQRQALAAMESMPKYIDMQQPVLRKVATIQEYMVR